MPAAAAPELPSCIALRSESNGSYLRYVHEHGETYKQLQLNGKDAINPYTRYDVQVSRRHVGLVHIRCRYNSKYWVARRLGSGDAWCIAADAHEPDEDLTSPNCTLIKPIVSTTATDDDGGESVMTVRFVGGAGDGKVTRRMMFAKDDAAPCMMFAKDGDDGAAGNDTFTVLNLVNSARLLPKFVMFKGDNGRFLAARRINNMNVLQFVVTDIGDGSARFELFPWNEGSFCIATNSRGASGESTLNTYWSLELGNWIAANRPQSFTVSNSSSWFWIHQVKDRFAIRSVRNLRFCKRLTESGFTNCLNAADRSITAEVRVAVEEPVLLREIHSISYRLDEARVYDTTVLTMATTAAVNDTSTENTKRLRLVYEEEEMSTWDATLELKLGYSSTIRAGFPKLGLGGHVSISADFFGAYNWGETTEKKVRHEVEYEAAVPPRTKVTIKAIAMRSAVDVPFTYWQRDITTDGRMENSRKSDGLYTGINSYNFDFETVEEKLPERIPVT